MTYIFVGESPSKRAIEIGATWQNGKLAGKTLRDALIANGLNPDEQHYCNLWCLPEEWPDRSPANYHRFIVGFLAFAVQFMGCQVVGMGHKVSESLEENNIPHIRIIHPAARGKIRKTERYNQHVAECLGVLKV